MKQLSDKEIDEALESFVISSHLEALTEKLEKLLSFPRKKKKLYQREIKLLKEKIAHHFRIMKD